MIARPGRLLRALVLGGLLVVGQAAAVSAASPSPGTPSGQPGPNGTTLTASPSVITATVQPGGETTATVTLRAGVALKVDVTAQGLGQSAEDGSFAFLDATQDTSRFTARPFMTIEPASFTMAAGESRPIRVTIRLPSGPADGERYAIVKINGLPTGSGGNVGVGVALGASVLVTLPDSPQTIAGKLEQLAASGGVPGQALVVSGLLRNTGNVHFGADPNQVEQTATLKNAKGEALVSATAPLTGNSIIPTFARAFSLTLQPNGQLGGGTYTVDVVSKLKDGTVLDQGTTTLAVAGTGAGTVIPPAPPTDQTTLLLAVLLGILIAAFVVGAVLGTRRLRRPAA